jgi:hypothetical protein
MDASQLKSKLKSKLVNKENLSANNRVNESSDKLKSNLYYPVHMRDTKHIPNAFPPKSRKARKVK